MTADLSALTLAELDVLRRERKAAADALFAEVTAGGRDATPAERARVNRLTRRWEVVLDEFEARGELVLVGA
jgi:hypothetical protein